MTTDHPNPLAGIGPRVIVNPEKLSAWLKATFNMHTAAEAFAPKLLSNFISEIDPLNETVTVDGEEHRIPPDCYLDLFADL